MLICVALLISNLHSNLAGNNLVGTLPDIFASFTKLTNINLSQNTISGTVPPSLGSITTLQLLWVEILYTFFFFFLTSYTYQPNTILYRVIMNYWNYFVCIMMAYRALNNNQLSGSIPDVWTNSINMQNFILSANLLTGTIPPSIGKMTALRQLLVFSDLVMTSLSA